MSYWLIVSTLFWAQTFSTYRSLDDCLLAAEAAKLPWYQSTACIPFPKPTGQAEHAH